MDTLVDMVRVLIKIGTVWCLFVLAINGPLVLGWVKKR